MGTEEVDDEGIVLTDARYENILDIVSLLIIIIYNNSVRYGDDRR